MTPDPTPRPDDDPQPTLAELGIDANAPSTGEPDPVAVSEEYLASARASVQYHEAGQVWIDACVEETKGEIAATQQALREQQWALDKLRALPPVQIDKSDVESALQTWEQRKKREADIQLAEYYVQCLEHDVALAESRYQGAREAADRVRPNIAEAKANLAAFEANHARVLKGEKVY